MKSFTILLFLSSLAWARVEPSLEELRWNLPQDLWVHKSEILLKGDYFRILDINDKTLLIYPSKDFTKEPFLKVNFPSLIESHENSKIECTYDFPKEKLSSHAIECGFRFCKPYEGTKPVPVHSISSYSLDYYTKDKKRCPVKLKDVITYSTFNSRNNFDIYTQSVEKYYNLKFISKDADSLKININGKDYFLDIRFCKDKPNECEVINYQKSLYEYALDNLEKHKKKKDLKVFNYLLENLLPCVKNRDLKCAQKFFVKNSDHIPEQLHRLSEDDWKELEACLNYDKVLPHYIGSRGINRVCIFEGYLYSGVEHKKSMVGLRIMDIGYPEAVKLRLPNTVYLEK